MGELLRSDDMEGSPAGALAARATPLLLEDSRATDGRDVAGPPSALSAATGTARPVGPFGVEAAAHVG